MPPREEGDKERQIRVGELIAAERVQYLYGLAVQSYEQSMGTQRTERQGAGLATGGTAVTLRTSYGDTRYLSAASRLVLLAMSRSSLRLLRRLPASSRKSDIIPCSHSSAAIAVADIPVRSDLVPWTHSRWRKEDLE